MYPYSPYKETVIKYKLVMIAAIENCCGRKTLRKYFSKNGLLRPVNSFAICDVTAHVL